MHKDLVLGFFKNASQMLRANGEIHVNHKTSSPFDKWDIEKLGMQSFLTLIECVDFKKEDYPGYNNKRGDSYRCDEPFPLGKCSTFKFIHNPRAMVKAKRRKQKCSRRQIRLLPFQLVQDNNNNNVQQLPSATKSVDLNCYPQPSYHHVSKFNETVASLYGLSNGYIPTTVWNHLSNFAHKRDATCDGYSAHSTTMSPGSRRLLPPMEPLNSFQPWSTLPNVRYSQADHARKFVNFDLPLGTRNECYQVFSCSSNYLQEAHGGIFQNSGHSYDILRPEFQSRISEMHWSALNGHSEQPRMSILMEDRRRIL